MINYLFQPYNELNLDLLYRILHLRSEVFVVEQNCIYQDMDGKDKDAMHVLGLSTDGSLLAYARILPEGIAYPEWSIGRVIVAKKARNTGEGHRLMAQCLECIFESAGKKAIRISAQSHLKQFYERHQFTATGKSYLEDGIPHIEMLYTPT